MKKYRRARKIPKNHQLLSHYPEIIAQLLFNRGITTREQAENFLNPQWEKHHDSFLLDEMEKVIERIQHAIENNEKITIYADYDADGIPGAVILADLFEKINYQNFDIYIPHRHKEGYGLHTDALKKIKVSGTQLIITIDLGIGAHEEAQWCTQHNIDLIITDHHLPSQNEDKREKLPQAFAIINPKKEKDTYPDPMLCGSGVIFKVIQAFIKKYGETYNIEKGWEKWLLDMVGIATISDMVPLRKENRLFAYFGMKVINAVAQHKNHHRPGLKTLLWNAGIRPTYMTEEDIAFGITPRINAASRMSHPQDALTVFRSQDEQSALQQGDHLTQLNNERKKLTKKTTEEALALLEEKEVSDLIVIGNPQWQLGILGLVASKLVEKYKVPVFVWSQEGDIIKGSCRSLDELHLVEIMHNAHIDSFIDFGGHAEAGGFACKIDEIESLEERLKTSLKTYKNNNQERSITQKEIDMELPINAISVHNYEETRKLAPFGVDNPKPLFLFKKVLIEKYGTFGRDANHLEIFFQNSLGKTIRGITFFKTPEDFPKLQQKKTCDIVAHMEYSVFRGKHELRLQIVDIL